VSGPAGALLRDLATQRWTSEFVADHGIVLEWAIEHPCAHREPVHFSTDPRGGRVRIWARTAAGTTVPITPDGLGAVRNNVALYDHYPEFIIRMQGVGARAFIRSRGFLRPYRI